MLVYIGTGVARGGISRFTSGALGSINGVSPVTVNSPPTFSVLQTAGGYTLLDLTQFNNPNSSSYVAFNPSQPLQLVLRNTLPNPTFNCAGHAVPFLSAVYTNADGAGGGLMGPYVPLIDYPELSGVPTIVPTAGAYAQALPACAGFPVPGANVPNPGATNSSGGLVDWPTYWPTSWPSKLSGQQPLMCPPTLNGNGMAEQPAVTFISTERYTLATGCTSTCTNIAFQSQQTTGGESSPGQSPPVPVAIVGSGFGYLAQALPLAVQAGASTGPGNVSLLRIQDCAFGNSCPQPDSYAWDTGTTANCQVYIANWTDSEIWLDLNVPIDATDVYLGGSSWTDLGGAPGPVYVVQTNNRIIERCILMATDPATSSSTQPAAPVPPPTSPNSGDAVGSPAIPAGSRWHWRARV